MMLMIRYIVTTTVVDDQLSDLVWCQISLNAPVGFGIPNIKSTYNVVSLQLFDIHRLVSFTSLDLCALRANNCQRSILPNKPSREPIIKLTREEKKIVRTLNQRFSQRLRFPFLEKLYSVARTSMVKT